jgi:hypothetical protein
MVEDGSWALKDILEGARFRIGVAPFPAGLARRVTLATTDGFGIYAGTRYPEAAGELLKFLVSKEYGRTMAEVHLRQPARESLVDEWAAVVRRQYPESAGGGRTAIDQRVPSSDYGTASGLCRFLSPNGCRPVEAEPPSINASLRRTTGLLRVCAGFSAQMGVGRWRQNRHRSTRQRLPAGDRAPAVGGGALDRAG